MRYQDDKAFMAEWAKKEAKGYQYGDDALINVHFGWEIARAALMEARPIERLYGPTTHVCWTPDYTPKEERELVTLVREADLQSLAAQLAAKEEECKRLKERAERAEAALVTMRPFFDKHALGPLAKPSCLCCGRSDYERVAVKHAELPGIVICESCKKTEAEREAMREDAERYRMIRNFDKFPSRGIMDGGRAAMMIGHWGEDLDREVDARIAAIDAEREKGAT